MGAYADFLLDAERPEEAARLTGPLRRIDALALRHAIARVRSQQDAADEIAALSAGFAAAHLRGEDVHLREEARFALEIERDFPRALGLAQRNWAVQHEPADARLLIAAAEAAGRPQDAAPAREWLRASKLEDARIPPAGEARK